MLLKNNDCLNNDAYILLEIQQTYKSQKLTQTLAIIIIIVVVIIIVIVITTPSSSTPIEAKESEEQSLKDGDSLVVDHDVDHGVHQHRLDKVQQVDEEQEEHEDLQPIGVAVTVVMVARCPLD